MIASLRPNASHLYRPSSRPEPRPHKRPGLLRSYPKPYQQVKNRRHPLEALGCLPLGHIFIQSDPCDWNGLCDCAVGLAEEGTDLLIACRSISVGAGAPLAPEFLARDGRALRQSLELAPNYFRVDAARTHVNAEPAIHRGHDVVPADGVGVAADALGDEF